MTRDGTAEPVARDQILRHARGQGNTIFPVQLTTSRIGNLTRLIHTLLYVMTIHTYILCSAFGLIVSEKKTEKMCVPLSHTHAYNMQIDAAGQSYKQTDSFVYLGCSAIETPDATTEIV